MMRTILLVMTVQVEAFDCDYRVVPIVGGSDIINATAECWCPPPPDGCYPVALESSTWGKIKSLYFSN
ncbi:MAG: hypothetical protein GTO51_05090 [Candidatus Latescibacteria bacterium]|nr:hypothetical protein [Candidatus Latescibacterota bacterium]NIO28377.1 hypothetical protein [Candidatus Latescibacterota bacterium]NIO55926.1 hypothetical protein [Candidatus Latescibacterota bacterium]NIT01890.1 hypothetical protein [Candidatus Latescibacterota bacterium]